jgi:hypothetical protein
MAGAVLSTGYTDTCIITELSISAEAGGLAICGCKRLSA